MPSTISTDVPVPRGHGTGVENRRTGFRGRCTLGRMNRLLRSLRDDRGDVPGWVLITLMTAGLVIIIWGLAGPALSSVFQQAIDRVVGF
jgi:hypothetical protein